MDGVYADTTPKQETHSFRAALVVVMVFVAIAAIIYLTYIVAQQRCEAAAVVCPAPVTCESPAVAAVQEMGGSDNSWVDWVDTMPPQAPAQDTAGDAAAAAAAAEPSVVLPPPPADETLPPEQDASQQEEEEPPLPDGEYEYEYRVTDDHAAASDGEEEFPIDSVVPMEDAEGSMCFYTGGTPNLLMCPWKK